MREDILSREIATNVTLALSTEPLANKEGCTTRHFDSSPNARLQYFILGGINVIWAFYDLATTMFAHGKQPDSIFKYALNAQKLSMNYRGGGKVTFGQTLLLIPLITAHIHSILDGNDYSDVYFVPSYVNLTLENTNTNDVADLDHFCRLALFQSKLSNNNNLIERSQPSPEFKGKYLNFIEASKQSDFKNLFIVEEIMNSYETSFQVLRKWENNRNIDILKFIEKEFPELKSRFKRYDVACDILAVVMYLIFAKERGKILFP